MSFDPAHLSQQLAQLPPARRYWVAYSGGCDSHVLLHALAQLRAQLGVTLHAVHVNHGLSKQADDWSHHCSEVCQKLDVPFVDISVNANASAGQSPEEAARLARYAALANVMEPGDGLLLAHHQDDQAETVMLQLLRGSGVRGLSAMPLHAPFGAGWLGRPLLVFSRASLGHYADSQGLEWIDDPSNFDTDFDRNFLRQDVLPRLKGRWPAADKTLARVAAHQAEAAELLGELAAQDYGHLQGEVEGTLSVVALRSLPVSRLRNVLRYWLNTIIGLPMPDARHLNRIIDEVLPAAADATPLVSWAGCEVRRFNERLYAFETVGIHRSDTIYAWDLQQPVRLASLGCELQPAKNTGKGLRASLAGRDDITIRFRQGGERCRPAGRGHTHQLKKLFQEWQVPPWLRERVPLIYVGNEIAEVVGYCVCEPFQAHAQEAGILITEVHT